MASTTAKLGAAAIAIVAGAMLLGSAAGLPTPFSGSEGGVAALNAQGVPVGSGLAAALYRGPFHPVRGDYDYGEQGGEFGADRGGFTTQVVFEVGSGPVGEHVRMFEQQQMLFVAVLEQHGYEPHRRDDEIVLTNCPFHALAEQHRDLVCGMNLDLLTGVIDGAGDADLLDARLAPEPGYCCVRVKTG